MSGAAVLIPPSLRDEIHELAVKNGVRLHELVRFLLEEQMTHGLDINKMHAAAYRMRDEKVRASLRFSKDVADRVSAERAAKEQVQ